MQSYDAGEFDALVAKAEGLKWRLIQMPGGAVKKPESYYLLYGQVNGLCMRGSAIWVCRASALGVCIGRCTPRELIRNA